nr:Cytosolic carboxypeptidase-like protein 5 [Polyrhizophydium stewartii]
MAFQGLRRGLVNMNSADPKLTNLLHEEKDVLKELAKVALRTLQHGSLCATGCFRNAAPPDAAKPTLAADCVFQIWTRPDGTDTETPTKNRTWFHFSVVYDPRPEHASAPSATQSHAASVARSKGKGAADASCITVAFRLMNLNKVKKLFAMGMRPVFRRAGDATWRRVPLPPVTKVSPDDGAMQMQFKFTWARDAAAAEAAAAAAVVMGVAGPAKLGTPTCPAPPGKYYFAYCVPYSYTDLQRRLDELDRWFAPSPAAVDSSAEAAESERMQAGCDAKESASDESNAGARTSIDSVSSGATSADSARSSESAPLAKTDSKPRKSRPRKPGKPSKIPRPVRKGSTEQLSSKASTTVKSTKPAMATTGKQQPLRGGVDDKIYFHRDLLANSIDGHRLDIITITSTDGMLPAREPSHDGLFPNKDPQLRSRAFQMVQLLHPRAGSNMLGLHVDASPLVGKQFIFISARVHPAETVSSFMMDGMLDFLLSADPRAVLLRSMFVFKLVPMLNPDGVVRGHYRGDIRGVNLNRVYADPDPAMYPTIWATKTYVESVLAAKLGPVKWYFDLHGHANKYGCFLFGNWIDDVEKQIEMLSFARCMHFNCPLFDFGECDFAPKGMVGATSGAAAGGASQRQQGDAVESLAGEAQDDASDGPLRARPATTPQVPGGASIEATKDGTGRVAMFRALGIHHCYTFEANYFGCRHDRRAPIRHPLEVAFYSGSGAAALSGSSSGLASGSGGGSASSMSAPASSHASLSGSTSSLALGGTKGGSAGTLSSSSSSVPADSRRGSLAGTHGSSGASTASISAAGFGGRIPRAPTADSRRFTLADLRAMGQSLLISVLDMEVPQHPWSRAAVADPLAMLGVQNWAIERVRRMYEHAGMALNETQIAAFLRKREGHLSRL